MPHCRSVEDYEALLPWCIELPSGQSTQQTALTMARRRWHDDWQWRAEQVHQLCQDRTVPLWQKAHLVGRAFADVELDALQSKHRKKLYSKLAAVNAILAKYPIECIFRPIVNTHSG